MSETQNTPFSTKCEILADLWMAYRKDEQFIDFIEYNDLGLPIAYAIHAEIVEAKSPAIDFINETFELLLSALDVEDTGYENLDDILGSAEK
jgi:hypothetical protein